MTEEKKRNFLSRGISVAELIGFGITIAGVLIVNYTSTQVRFNSLELRMNGVESQYGKISTQLERIENKQDEAKESMHKLETQIINKQDRKN